MSIQIKKDCLKEIKKEALDKYPEECNGFLIGKKIEKSIFKVNDIGFSKNIDAKKKNSFKIRPEKVLEKIDNQHNNKVIGFYHSHPKKLAEASKKDLKFMKLWPKKIWLIMATTSREIIEISCFKYEENQLITFEITEI